MGDIREGMGQRRWLRPLWRPVALAMLLAGPAAEAFLSGVTEAGIVILWISAVLTLFTGYDYLKAAIRHAIEQ